MLIVLLITFIVITIYGVVCVQLAHFSWCDWRDISIGHVIVITKLEISTFPIAIIFFCGCVLRCLLHHILSVIAYTFRENWDFVFIIVAQLMMSANSRLRFGLQILFVWTLQHILIFSVRLSEDTEITKFPSNLFCRVCEWDKAYSLSYPLYNIWGCVFSVYPLSLWWLRLIYTLSYFLISFFISAHFHQVWSLRIITFFQLLLNGSILYGRQLNPLIQNISWRIM